jgi:prepilin-type N-terminal cleavage/methylation domain-containing protein
MTPTSTVRPHSRTDHPGRFKPAKRRSFTLLELVVVIVIIGILALLAVPTFQSIIDRSQVESANTTLSSLVREAQTLAAYDGRSTWNAGDFTAAVADLPAAQQGVSAAAWTIVDGDVQPPTGSISVSISGDESTAGLSIATDGGCAAVSAQTTGPAERVQADPCTGDGARAAGTAPLGPLGPVTAASATGGDHAVVVSWTPGANSTSTRLQRRDTGQTTVAEEVVVPNTDCSTTCSWTFAGLTAQETYEVVVTAQQNSALSDDVVVSSVSGGSRALLALHDDDSVTRHPFSTWPEGDALFAALSGTPGIVAVSYETPVEPASLNVPAVAFPSPDPSRSVQWNLDLTRGEDTWCVADGSGVGIAVIDSGVSPLADFGGHVASGYQYDGNTGTGRSPEPGDTHGTEVASTIISQPNNVGITGVAPGATVVPYDVSIGPGAGVDAAAFYTAWKHAINNPNVDIINISLSNEVSPGIKERLQTALGVTDPVGAIDNRLADTAIDAGKVTVSATGNSDKRVVSYPAAADQVIAVSAIDSDGGRGTDWWPGGGSSWGEYNDIAAPAGTAGGPNSGIPVYDLSGNVTQAFAGTSYAAPQVAGIAALLKDADSGIGPVAIYEALTESARDLGSTGWDERFGWGLVDAVGALHHIDAAGPAGCATSGPPTTTTTTTPTTTTPPGGFTGPAAGGTAPQLVDPADNYYIDYNPTAAAIAPDDTYTASVHHGDGNGYLADWAAPYDSGSDFGNGAAVPGLAGFGENVTGAAYDSSGNYYFATDSVLYRRGPGSASVTSVAGTVWDYGCSSGAQSGASLGLTTGLARDPDTGTLWISSYCLSGNSLFSVTPAGVATLVATIGDVKVATVSGGKVYLAETFNYGSQQLWAYDIASNTSAAVGSNTYNGVDSIAAWGGSLYVTDWLDDVIYRVNPTTGYRAVFAGSPGTQGDNSGALATSLLIRPRALAVTSDGAALVFLVSPSSFSGPWTTRVITTP